MGQAQKKQAEQTARVRTLPPPLPRRSDIAPVAAAAKPRSAPPPPPAAALRVSRPPQLSLTAPAPVAAPVHLALLPQWEDANASLRPAPKKSNKLFYLLGSAALSLGAGALVAAGLMNVGPFDNAPALPQAQADHVVATQLAPEPVAEVTNSVTHVEEFALEDGIAINALPAERAPIVIPMLTVTSKLAAKPAKPSKRGKVSNKHAQATQLVAAQPDPRDEAEVEAESAPEAETAEAAETTAAQDTSEAAAEPAAPEVVEPAAPALPEKLTRDQVRGGLEAVRSQVLACTNGTYGKVLADVTISAPGRVSQAVIEGTFAGTNAGSCMARVLRTAQFPAFSGQEISVRYPFSF